MYYAVVPWIAYPLAGGVFGGYVARAADRARIFQRGALVGVALIAAGIAWFIAAPPTFDVNTYWRMPPAYFVAISGLVLVWLYGCDLAV
ncbi:MAG: hypothetical protein ABUL57_00500, partial [Chloroflexota bacterium]